MSLYNQLKMGKYGDVFSATPVGKKIEDNDKLL